MFHYNYTHNSFLLNKHLRIHLKIIVLCSLQFILLQNSELDN